MLWSQRHSRYISFLTLLDKKTVLISFGQVSFTDITTYAGLNATCAANVLLQLPLLLLNSPFTAAYPASGIASTVLSRVTTVLVYCSNGLKQFML